MRLKSSDLTCELTAAEISSVQETLRRGGGGMVVVPLKNGRRLTPHLVPARRHGGVDQRALDRLVGRLRAMDCNHVLLVDETGARWHCFGRITVLAPAGPQKY